MISRRPLVHKHKYLHLIRWLLPLRQVDKELIILNNGSLFAGIELFNETKIDEYVDVEWIELSIHRAE